MTTLLSADSMSKLKPLLVSAMVELIRQKRFAEAEAVLEAGCLSDTSAEAIAANSNKAQELLEENERLAAENETLRAGAAEAINNGNRLHDENERLFSVVRLQEERIRKLTADNERVEGVLDRINERYAASNDQRIAAERERDEWQALAEAYAEGKPLPPRPGSKLDSAKQGRDSHRSGRPYAYPQNKTGITPDAMQKALNVNGHKLTARDRSLLAYRFGLDGNRHPHPTDETAKQFNLPSEHSVSPLVNRALITIGLTPKRHARTSPVANAASATRPAAQDTLNTDREL